jgi:hypothetical protein
LAAVKLQRPPLEITHKVVGDTITRLAASQLAAQARQFSALVNSSVIGAATILERGFNDIDVKQLLLLLYQITFTHQEYEKHIPTIYLHKQTYGILCVLIYYCEHYSQN